MAVSHVASSSAVNGTTTIDVGYPAGIQAGDSLWLGAGASASDVVSFPDISGWTKVYDVALGGGTIGAGTGPRRIGLYHRIATGSESGTVTVTPTGGSNVIRGLMDAWRVASGKVFDIDYETGEDTSTGSATSITAGSVLGETAGNNMLGLIVAPANSNMSGQTFSAPGASYGTASEISDGGTNNGDDVRVAFVERPISSGTATAATVYSASSTQSAGCIFICIREADPPALTVQDAAHGHAADSVVLTQVHVLTVADAAHGHAADSVALTQVHVLTVADATHGHTADNVVVTEDSGSVDLVVADAGHGHAADSVALTQVHVLTVADAGHGHAADGVVLTQVHVLTVADADHGHAADGVVLTQVHVLVVADASQAHTADNVVLSTGASVYARLGGQSLPVTLSGAVRIGGISVSFG